jgi:hypothetical protein
MFDEKAPIIQGWKLRAMISIQTFNSGNTLDQAQVWILFSQHWNIYRIVTDSDCKH